ncbi:MAG TPA: hypothetical protein VJH55_01950 [Candidatus Paceibacterota bacterium]
MISENLSALSILCQGYLMAFATTGKPRSQKVKKALQKMGCTDMLLSKVTCPKPEKIAETHSVGFWLEPFECEILEFERALCKELGMQSLPQNHPLKQLIVSLEKGRVEEADVVAEAYLFLDRKLT